MKLSKAVLCIDVMADGKFCNEIFDGQPGDRCPSCGNSTLFVLASWFDGHENLTWRDNHAGALELLR